jgi:Zn-dependent protease/CBS domain-containing protein
MAAGRPGAIRVGRFLGVPIYADMSLFLTGALVVVGLLPRLEASDPAAGNRTYVVAVVFAVLLYLSILVHELAHAAVGRAYGLPVRSVALSMLGGVTDLGRAPEGPGRSFAISAAGPAATLAIAAVGWLSLQVATGDGLLRALLIQLTFSNVVVGIYNLLPGLPLDGGSMLAAVLWRVTGSELAGMRAAAWAGRGVAVLTGASPFVIAWLAGSPPTTLFVIWAAVLAVVLWNGSTQALRAAKVRGRLPQLALRGLVRPALPVHGTTPLAEALRQLADAKAGGLVVVDSDGRPVGLVSEAAVAATPAERRPWVTVTDVSRTLDEGMVLSSDLVGERLLEALRQEPATEYLVVDPADHKIVGMLATSDIERHFSDV